MKLLSQTKNFLRRLDEDESAPNTVEWVLLVIVALIVLIVIWFIARWAMKKGDTGSQEVNKQIDSGTKDAENVGKNLGVQ